jgi:hypothetical protein
MQDFRGFTTDRHFAIRLYVPLFALSDSSHQTGTHVTSRDGVDGVPRFIQLAAALPRQSMNVSTTGDCHLLQVGEGHLYVCVSPAFKAIMIMSNVSLQSVAATQPPIERLSLDGRAIEISPLISIGRARCNQSAESADE